MTTKDHIAAAVEALDEARRAIEQLEASPCGDEDADDAVSEIREQIEASIGGFYLFTQECAG